MDSKIKVHGKAQSRTVLGIVEAYLLLHPESTKEDLDKAFPETLSSAAGESLFLDVKNKDSVKNYEKRYFERDDETIFLADGTELAMIEAWTKADYNKVVEHAKQFGIEVAEFSKTARPGERGSFWLEGLNDYDVEAAQENFKALAAGNAPVAHEEKAEAPSETRALGSKLDSPRENENADPFLAAAASLPNTKKEVEEVSDDDSNASCNCKWIPVILMLMLFGFFMMKACNDDKDFSCGYEDRETFVRDSLYQDSVFRAKALADSLAAARDTIQKDVIVTAETVDDIAKAIEDNMEKGVSSSFDNINFETGSAELSEGSKNALDGIVKFLKDNPDKKIKVIGHSSTDGTDEINIPLSKERAKAVTDYIEKQGIEGSRLSYQGMGSSKPISEVPEKNRRVEIQVF
jgi:outer membrane protein OmpA-like peptidoglycan-associated protein